MAGEFDIIARHFRSARRADLRVGIGDDAAVLRPPTDRELAVAVDTIVAGVHFPEATPPAAIGYRALAVNLSDLAAMGADPAWVLLALTLPEEDEIWLEQFAAGFMRLAEASGLALVGGDTTRGPLSVTVTVLGFLPVGRALLRSGARPGDLICVSGMPGAAAAGLRALQEDRHGPAAEVLRARFLYPAPRCVLGGQLLGRATAAIDVSDGLAADLGHILEQSGVGARLEAGRLPLAPEAVELFGATAARELALTGGDDYELCFTLPDEQFASLARLARELGLPLTRIGVIEDRPGLRILDVDGQPLRLARAGYDHFGGAGP